MKEVTISSTSEKGDAAIKKHLEEFNKMGFKDRLIFKTAGYKQEVIRELPYVLLLTINNRHVINPMFLDLILKQIEDALKQNGAERDIDYTIEIGD